MLMRTFLLSLPALLVVFACEKEPETPPPIPSQAGGSGTGNALEQTTLNTFEAHIPQDDSLLRLELHQVEARGFFPPSPPLPITPPPKTPQPADTIERPSRPVLLAAHIDRDGDGFGPGSPLGEDRDDADPQVHQSLPADSLEIWLHKLGFTPRRIHVLRVGQTLQNIADNLQAGDVVVLQGGLHTSGGLLPKRGTQGTAENPVYIFGWPGERTILAPPFPMNLRDIAHVRFHGIFWRNSAPGAAVLRLENGEHIHFYQCVFENGQAGGLQVNQSREVVVNSSVLRNNAFGPGLLWSGTQSHGLQVEFSSLHGNAAEGLLWNAHSGTLLLESSVLFNNQGASLHFYAAQGTLLLRNNLLLSQTQSALIVQSPENSVGEMNKLQAEIHGNSIWTRTAHPQAAFVLDLHSGTQNHIHFRQNILQTQTGPALHARDSLLWDRILASDNILFTADGGAVLGLGTDNIRLDLSILAQEKPGLRGNHQRNPQFRPLQF